jgi:Toastrack DUF4097
MNNHNKLLLTTIAVVGVIGLVGSSLAARRMGPTHMSDATPHNAPHLDNRDHDGADRQDRSRDRVRSGPEELGLLLFEEAFANMESLEVQMGDADVILEESRGDQITVAFYVDGHGEDAWARDVFERMEFQAEASGTSLYVESTGPQVERWEWSDHRGYTATVVVGVPPALDIAVRTGDGDITAKRLTGRVALSSADGDVGIDSAEGDALNVSTADGDIRIDRLSTGQAQISTADGDISLDDVRAPLAVSTGDGDIRIIFAEANEATVSTGDGDVVLFVPSTLRASFRLVGEDLNITPGMELRGRLRDDMIEGDLNGGGPQIEVRTGDGSVTLRQRD